MFRITSYNVCYTKLLRLKIREELKNRDVNETDIIENFVDITQVFKNTKCKVIAKAFKQKNPVLAVNLPGFNGLLKKDLAGGMRLGAELAGMASYNFV